MAPVVANVGSDDQPQNLAANLLAAVQNQRHLMEEALMRLSLSNIAACELMNNVENESDYYTDRVRMNE